MTGLYPQIEPYDHGTLDVGAGNLVYWEVCCNPDGKPAVVLHGGPGSGCTTNVRRYFDPRMYRIVLFEQRGCGRSTPHASEPEIDLSTNTTQHLLTDMEQLRTQLGIDRWLVFGAFLPPFHLMHRRGKLLPNAPLPPPSPPPRTAWRSLKRLSPTTCLVRPERAGEGPGPAE
jgi:hypothetical protein